MIFYEVEHCDGHFLMPTQDAAKRAAREHKCTWSQVDIPTDKKGLMDYINDLLESIQIAKYGRVVNGGVPLSDPQPETAQEQQEEALVDAVIASEDRTGPKGHRIAERAVLMGVKREVAEITDQIMDMEGEALGQCALAVASRYKELAT